MGQSATIHARTELSSACSIGLSTSQSMTHQVDVSSYLEFNRRLNVDTAEEFCLAEVEECVAER